MIRAGNQQLWESDT